MLPTGEPTLGQAGMHPVYQQSSDSPIREPTESETQDVDSAFLEVLGAQTSYFIRNVSN